jgi:hypothetical protein
MKRGIALPTMVLVLAMTSALAVSGSFVARQMAANVRVRERAAALGPLAESALVEAAATWDSTARAGQETGATVPLTSAAVGAIRVGLWVTRLSADVYWLVAEARQETRPRIGRRLGVVLRVINGIPTPVAERAWSELP